MGTAASDGDPRADQMSAICRCLGCWQNTSASGALIRTQPGIRASAGIVIETFAPALGLQGRELPAYIVRAGPGEIAVEWLELPSTDFLPVLTEARLTGRYGEGGCRAPELGPVRNCALASVAAA